MDAICGFDYTGADGGDDAPGLDWYSSERQPVRLSFFGGVCRMGVRFDGVFDQQNEPTKRAKSLAAAFFHQERVFAVPTHPAASFVAG